MRIIDADALFEPNESTDKVLIFGRNGGKTIALAEKMMRERVNMAPTLTLDDLRPKGRWEVVDGLLYARDVCECSLCRKRETMCASQHKPFCPSCGADMRGGGEDA